MVLLLSKYREEGSTELENGGLQRRQSPRKRFVKVEDKAQVHP
jgi:hypothetical protein